MINNVDMDRNEAPNYMLFLVLSETEWHRHVNLQQMPLMRRDLRGQEPAHWVMFRLELVGALEHSDYDFPYIGNVIIPTDELHHFS